MRRAAQGRSPAEPHTMRARTMQEMSSATSCHCGRVVTVDEDAILTNVAAASAEVIVGFMKRPRRMEGAGQADDPW